jgi:hypothetical protein
MNHPVTAGRRLVLFCLVTASGLLLSPQGASAFWVEAFVSYILANKTVDNAKAAGGELIDKMDQLIQKAITKAREAHDQALEKQGLEISRRLQEARQVMNEMIDKAFEKTAREREAFFRQLAEERRAFFEGLDQQRREFFQQVDARIAGAAVATQSVVRNLHVLALDTLEEIPFAVGPTVLSIPDFGMATNGPAHLAGQTQIFKSRGDYRFRAVGRELGTSGININLGGKVIPTAANNQGLFVRDFSVPVADLNGYFLEFRHYEAEIRFLASDKNKKEHAAYRPSIKLLPKWPLTYRLTELLPDQQSRRVFVQELPDVYEREAEQGRAEARRTQRLAEMDVVLQVARRHARVSEIARTHLPFGTCFVDLSPAALSYELSIEWWTGEAAVLTPAATNKKQVAVALHVLQGNDGAPRKRLQIDVGDKPPLQ